jgi:hypothetical protein
VAGTSRAAASTASNRHTHSDDCRRSSAPSFLLLGVLGPAIAFALAGYLTLQGAASKGETLSKAFVSTAQFWIWCLLVCTQAAVWVLALGLVGPIVRRRWRHEAAGARRRLGVLAAVLLTIAGVAATALGVRRGATFFGLRHVPFGHLSIGDIPLAGYSTKAAALVSIGLVVAFVTCLAAAATATTLNESEPAAEPTPDDLRCFLALRGDLSALLGVLGVLLAVSTLTTGALRSAMLAVNGEPAYTRLNGPRLEFASQYVLAYGLLCAVLLAVAFLPSFLAMRAAGARLLDAACPLPGPGAADFGDRVARRGTLESVLQTSLSGNPTVKAGAAILAPLAAGIASLLLPT